MESSITETLMREPLSDRLEDGVVGSVLVDDSMVSGGKKGIVMESDEKNYGFLENGFDNRGSDMRLNGEVAGSGVLDNGKFGGNGNLVESGVGKIASMPAINLVVDLRHCSRKESDRSNTVESDVNKANDVEFMEKEGEYEFADLVWGKVKNHLWWPGQIINPSGSRDEAMKHFKKDGFHIAYFGGQKFAFSELNGIKPFRINFCKMENQSNGEGFIHAVNHALQEAARRVEFGLTCLCVSEEVYDKSESQMIVNSGVKTESSGDRFSTINSFNPDKTIDFIQDLAKDPFGISRLDVSTIGGQLSAFNRWKGYHQIQLNQVLDEFDDEFDVINSALHPKEKLNARGRPRKRRQLFDGGFSPKKKVRCLSELMSDSVESVSDVEYKPKKRGRKRKAIESNRSGKGSQKSQSQTADEFLSQVYLAAINPMEGWRNLDSLVKFSSDFKNYWLRENKDDEEIANQPETLETDGFTGTKDSCWTDMTIETKSDLTLIPNKENSAAALTFKFTNLDPVPSVRKLHEIYRRYGALQETETRVLNKKNCVRLVFERKCDAEAAFSSSGKFSIFGPALVSYRLNFSPTLRKKDTVGKRGA
ncbi:hypothetical protein SSX86_018622 [Deinandra increscens subsp. villosa]|uniref:PWWP domain-containing protein n=1 Tax=Deinandra increscens subsp. villosa TaxID=3103831 RepID=A0AAP0GTQ2_9ASTR